MGFGYGPWGLSFWEIIILIWLCTLFFKPRDSKRLDQAMDDFNAQFSKEKAHYEQVLDSYEEDLDTAERKIEDLEDRVRVLERIVTDEHKSKTLKDEIDNLRQQG